jgi:hypothetical protein
MNIFKAALGIATAAALIPYKAKSTPVSEEENAPKNLTVESLVYRVEVTPRTDEAGNATEGHNVRFVIPADGIKKVYAFLKEKAPTVKEKATVAKEKAVEVKDKVCDKAEEFREKCAAKRAAKCTECDPTEVPEEEITIEVQPEATGATAEKKTAAPKKRPVKKTDAEA